MGKSMSCDDILELIDGGNHFGEPLIALKYSNNLTDSERRAIQILNIDHKGKSEVGEQALIKLKSFDRKTMRLQRKRKRRSHAYKMKNKHQKHREVHRQYSYYRSRR